MNGSKIKWLFYKKKSKLIKSISLWKWTGWNTQSTQSAFEDQITLKIQCTQMLHIPHNSSIHFVFTDILIAWAQTVTEVKELSALPQILKA